MALIKCHECGNDVSTQAAACPRCGAPPLPPVIQTPPPVIPAYPPSPVPKPKRSFLLICIVLLFGGLVVVFVAIAIADALATKSQDAAKPVQPAASAVVKSTPSPVIPPPTAPTWTCRCLHQRCSEAPLPNRGEARRRWWNPHLRQSQPAGENEARHFIGTALGRGQREAPW